MTPSITRPAAVPRSGSVGRRLGGWAAVGAIVLGSALGCGTPAGPDAASTQPASTQPTSAASPSAPAGSSTTASDTTPSSTTATSATPTGTAPTGTDSPTGDGSSTSTPTASDQGSDPIAACGSAQLETGVENSRGGAGMGSLFLLVTFTNTGQDSCTLYGWPGVSLVRSSKGAQIGAAATRVQADDRRTVTLRSGAETTALLKVTQAGNYPASRCGLREAAGLRIYAPGQTASTFVKRSTDGCTKKSGKVLAVAPVGTSN